MRCLSVPLLTILGAVAQSSGADDSTKPPAVSAAFTKARVEAGEGVPFFDERFSCREDGGAWSAFRELVEYARLRVFEGDEGEVLARQLAFLLADRTTNMTEVLQCNVGVIAGYHLLARRYVAAGDNWKAYRLLQLALIYVFTLRNALQVPPDLAHDWATRTDLIVEEIKVLKVRLGQEQQRRLARLPEVSPNFRVPGLRVAVVSICAYPEDHPLVLRVITPENRRLYAEKHGYGLHVHMKHPMPDTGVHIQHAKLQLVADYLRSGEYDWVAWMDCDSIIMNLNYTLDSIIHRYARRSARSGGTVPSKDKGKKTKKVDVDSIGGESETGKGGTADNFEVPWSAALQEAEPLEDEVLEAFVSHVGSCNSDEGCRMSAQVRVNPRTSYAVSIRAAQIDMESDSERLASVTVGGLELGECNPKPESDYDCRLHSCFSGIEVPKEAIATGIVELQVHSVRTHSDCRCSLLHGVCYSGAVAAFEEANAGEKMTDPSYGAFVKFTLTPKAANYSLASEAILPRLADGSSDNDNNDDDDNNNNNNNNNNNKNNNNNNSSGCGAPDSETDISDGCSCNPPRAGSCANPRRFQWWFLDNRAPSGEGSRAALRRRGAECDGPDVLLGISVSLPLCLQICREVEGCEFVSYGVGKKRGQCHWEVNDCLEFEEDSYLVYDVRPTLSRALVSAAGASGLSCSQLCSAGQEEEEELEEEGVDLLITEEGWGLSSANWLIRRSSWSIAFLDRAFELCHRDLPLFGDQDAMIHLLFNPLALQYEVSGDPLDPHAVIVPQREINAYDALNAHFMGCDGYHAGDLLVTFPGCKAPEACNGLFNMAADYAKGLVSSERNMDEPVSADHLRLFGPGELAAEVFKASRN